MYVSGRVDILDIVDIDLFTVLVLNMMVLKLGYTGKSEPMFYNYLRPLTSLDEGLYDLAYEKDVHCLVTLVRSFNLIEVYIKHGVTALDSYLRAPRFRETIEEITDEHGSIVIDDVMRQLSFDETELDEEAGFADVAGSGVDSLRLGHDESFGVDDLDLNINKPINLNVSQVKTPYELYVSEKPDVEVRTQVPIVEEVGIQEFSVEDVVLENYVSSGEDAEQYNDLSTNDDDDVDEDFLVNKENEFVEPDVDVYLFGISMDLHFDNIGVTNLVSDDVLEGEGVNNKYNTGEGYHAVPPPYTRNFMPPKPDLVFADEHVVSESVTSLLGIAKSKAKTSELKLKTISEPIIKDWVSDSDDENEIETETKQMKPIFAKIRALVDRKKIIVTEASIRHDLQLQDAEGTACLPNDTIFEELARMWRKQRKETKVPYIEPQTKESIPTPSNDPLPSGEDRMQLTELMNLCINLQKQVFDLEKAKTAQAKDIADLKKRVKKLERKKKLKTSGLKRLWKGRMIDNIDQDIEITLVNESQGRMNEEEMFEANDLDGDEVIVDATAGEKVEQSTKVAEKEVSTADPVITAGEVVTTAEDVEATTAATTPQISKDELILAQTLIEIKAAKPKAREVIVQEPSKFRTTSSSQPSQLPQAKDKEEERITREKDEATIAMIEQWDKVQAKINADLELAQKLQTKEQEQLTDAEKARLFMEFLEKRRKLFARKREIKKRNRPPTKAQQRRNELEKESAKRQKLEKEDDSTELKKCLEIVHEDDDDVTIEATPLSSKYPTIVDYKIYKEGKKRYFKIIRADGNS
uniref:Uncharacterized protein n=1 Tax=Tanacetum cinerariifolium TaxID=118510 RepID=A0A6L2J3U3_TANCI|nr:hypothetical protein [Tanacetum cinerariifolium]